MKVLKGIFMLVGGVILLLIILVILMVTVFFSVNSKEQKNNEIILEGNGNETALILYQDSRFGLTKKVINSVAEDLQKEGYSVTINHPRADLDYDIDKYNIIVLATPIYGGQASQAIITYADNTDFSEKKVLVIATGASIEDMREVEELKSHINNAKFLTGIKVNSVNESLNNSIKELIN